MVASHVADGTTYEGTTTGNVLPLVYPAGVQAGDIAIAIYVGNVAVAPRDQTPLGFTPIFSHASLTDTALPNLYVGFKVCNGSESSTTVNFDVVNAVHLGRILVFRGIDPANLVSGAWVQQASGATLVLTGVTMPATGSVLLYAAALNSTVATATAPTAPAAFTEALDKNTGTRSGTAGWLIWSGSGASGNVSPVWSAGGARSMGVLIGLPASVPSASDNFFQFL